MKVPPNAKTQARSQVTREKLAEAAAQVFAEEGYDGATVALIARRAGVTKGAIYANYLTKAELLQEVIRSRLRQQVDSSAFRESAETDTSRLFLDLTRDRLSSDRPLTRALLLQTFAAAGRDDGVRMVVQEWLGEILRWFTIQVRRSQKAGRVDKNVHAPTLAWIYLMPAAMEILTEAAGLELPKTEDFLPLAERFANAFRGTDVQSRSDDGP